MNSTTSSDQLTLLSYGTFYYLIPIYDPSGSTLRQHQWKQAETMIALVFSFYYYCRTYNYIQVQGKNGSIFNNEQK